MDGVSADDRNFDVGWALSLGIPVNRPLALSHGGKTYRLRFAKATGDGVWEPGYFTSFTPAGEVDLKTIKRRNRQNGVGGALVGALVTPFWTGGHGRFFSRSTSM